MSIPFISVFQTNICIHKPFPLRIINPAPQIIQSRLLIVHIPTIAERIQRTNRRCQTAGFADRITPCVITIFYHLCTIRVNQRNHIALQIVDIEVIDIVIGDHTGLTLRIIEEMQIMAALRHVDDIFAIQRINVSTCHLGALNGRVFFGKKRKDLRFLESLYLGRGDRI